MLAGAELGPLHGVPVTTKINSDQAGSATTNGLVAFKDNIAAADSPQVANLRRGGAILIGRSNAPAFSFRWFTDNDLHGLTLNPWSADHTPGGSSGGAAAATAAGLAPVAQGNDIGGSLRYPAYACGVVGLRPTVGRVAGLHRPPNQDSALSVQAFAVDGPLARSIPDLRLAMECMTAPDPRDSVHVPGAPAAPPASRPLKVALVRDVGVAAPAAAVGAALEQAAEWLTAAGYLVEEVELPLLEEAYRLWWLLAMEEFRLVLPLVEQVGDEAIKQAMRDCYEVVADWHGAEPSLVDFISGYARRGTLIELLSVFMDEFPLVLLPVSTEQAFEQGADLEGPESVAKLIAAQWSQMAIPTLGFPALSVPTGLADGLPVGVQLLGRRFGEEDILEAGEVIEARAGRSTPIDPSPSSRR